MFRRPRPDTPILPQNAIYRTEPLKPFKRPKGRKGRKPRGVKLKPRNLSQFNKFHTEAARNKERDRAEQERIDKIRERDEARRERSDRLQIEDRRYAAKVITDARERAAERGFRAEQLRLLRQQAAAPPPAINIAPAAVNIAPAAVDVRPVINIPASQRGEAGGQAQPRRVGGGRGQVDLSPEEQQEARDAIYAGLVGRADTIPRWAAAQLQQEQERRLAAERGLDVERQNRLAITDRAKQEIQTEQGLRRQAEREREEAGLAAAQAQRDLLQRVQSRDAERERDTEQRILAAQRQAGRQLEEARQQSGQGEQELTQQLSRAQRARNEAEDRARQNQARAEELERHNQTLQQQRDQDPEDRAALRREVVDGVREEVEIDVGDRLEQQYRDLVLRQASQAQRQNPEFQRRLEQEAFRVGDRLVIPFAREGEDISEEDRPFRINPFRPENEEFLRRELAESRVLQGGLGRLRSELGVKQKVKITQADVDREIETIKRLEREEQRRRLGRGSAPPESFAGFERDFSSDEEQERTTLQPAQIDPLTQSQFDRDLPAPAFDFSLELDSDAEEEPLSRETPREQAERQALERQASQEKVAGTLGTLDFSPPEPQPEPTPREIAESGQRAIQEAEADLALDSSLESETDPWEVVRDNYRAGNETKFHKTGKGDRKTGKLRDDLTHFSFRDDEGYVGGGASKGRFKGKELVVLHANPKKRNIVVRTKDSMGQTLDSNRDVEGTMKFDFFDSLVEQGEIQLVERDSELKELAQQREEPSVVGQAAGAVGGAVATAGGIMGNAALGAARGVAGGVYDRLPSAGDIGEAAGRGAVAVGSAAAGVVRGGIQALTSPRDPVVGEQTGGRQLPTGLGKVEDTDEI
jgi:hypothetical protein